MTDWKLVYRGSRDGFGAKDFHNNCDGVTNTLTVVKATSGYIFGGFVEKPWSSTFGSLDDPKAFIFSMVNKDQKPFKRMCSGYQSAISCDQNYGPSFGGKDDYGDFDIANDSNSNNGKQNNISFEFI